MSTNKAASIRARLKNIADKVNSPHAKYEKSSSI